jgi:hypothetical protein
MLLLTGHDYVAKFFAQRINFDITDLIDLSQNNPNDYQRSNYSFGHPRAIDNFKLKEEFKLISLETEIFLNSFYMMDQAPRGYCLLINNYFTVGTYKEMEHFRYIFFQFHFDVIMKKNMNCKEIILLLAEIAKRTELNYHNAFALMIITHGNENNEIYGFDGAALKIRYLMDIMNNENCSTLKNKPKLYFINSCRGRA